ncbi:hypothetical protein HNP46_000192 [Pseudomonas nitritireducens]|uniref:Uncharacterized protein n=1 Tax=Pseudomonas nitroreducens TaxID=46680 RepID=A0A7W7NYE9_PSENT|nr:hypothetical protein [Pseudomonas nitritireducens]MBB4861381.1 hypothetical protein [Pseudomonas nitritireducens]
MSEVKGHAGTGRSLKDLLEEDDEDFELGNDIQEMSARHRAWLDDATPPAMRKNPNPPGTPPNHYAPRSTSAPPKAPSPPVAPAKKPPTTSSQPKSFVFYKALQAYVQALREAVGIYLNVISNNPGLSKEELKAKVSVMCKDHLTLIDLVLDVNGAPNADVMARLWRRLVGGNLSKMYDRASFAQLEGVVEVSKQWLLETEEFNEYRLEEATSDSMLTVKLELYNGALTAFQDLDGLWGVWMPHEVVQALQKAALALSKEVAFTWSRQVDITDKELLFKSLLNPTLQLASRAYVEALCEQLPELDYLEHDPQMPLPLLESVIAELDMGYSGKALEDLLVRMRTMAKAYADNAKVPKLGQVETLRWRSAYLKGLDKLMGESWSEAGERLIDDLSAMSVAQREEYTIKHPTMEFSLFERSFKDRLDTLEDPLIDIEPDLKEILPRARRHMSWVWGISDAMIAAKNDGKPEDYR